jgi:4-hydroxy-3-polyprenylbenzoate decarboxylase
LQTISNHILGTGQLSLAKYLFIAAKEDNAALNTHQEKAFFSHIFERIQLQRDLHFHTQTSIDTLDYSGDGLNTGSKLVLAAAGKKRRELGTQIPTLSLPQIFSQIHIALPGVLTISGAKFQSYSDAEIQMHELIASIPVSLEQTFPLIVVCDDAEFTAQTFNNWVWVTFTRSNPSHDIYGVDAFQKNKHWGCYGSLIIDARIKPHHAPVLELDSNVESRVDSILSRIN